MLRIVGGAHRGRRLVTPAGAAVRPTADRVREALFSMLASGRYGGDRVTDAHVLDACAGSGALGLEALSRGAASAVFMDNAGAALEAIRANIATLAVADRARVLRADVTRPPPAPHACSLLFLDPPYDAGIAGTALTALAGAGWLAPDALAVVEQDARTDVSAPEGFELNTERKFGRVRLVLMDVAR